MYLLLFFILSTSQIEEVFKRTVNGQLSGDSGTCNEYFQHVQSVSAQVDFIYNGKDLNGSTTEQQRSLGDVEHSQRGLQQNPTESPTTAFADLQETPTEADG